MKIIFLDIDGLTKKCSDLAIKILNNGNKKNNI
jgi:hypothetical protein